MKIHTFIADSAPEAVAQIRAELGAEAVVLNVRKVEAGGLGKLWRKPQIEVLAHLPEPTAPAADPLQALSDLRREIADLKQSIPPPTPSKPEPIVEREVVTASRVDYGPWKVGHVLEQTGVLPRNVQRIIDAIEDEHGSNAPAELSKQFDLARAAILKINQHRPTSIPTPGGVHIFVGPPGSGKTTALSKRLAQIVLIEGAPARVLRLDGLRANTAESLSVYCEILGVEVDRCLPDHITTNVGETIFLDLPGVNASDIQGLKSLAKTIAAFPGVQVHLTLNAAYEISTLLNQLRAYSFLAVTDLILTHLDEESRWGKLLNFFSGTKIPVAFLSAGQNVPGDLTPATLEKVLPRVIPSK